MFPQTLQKSQIIIMYIQCLQNSLLSMIKHSIVHFTFEEKENIPNKDKLRTAYIHTAFPQALK